MNDQTTDAAPTIDDVKATILAERDRLTKALADMRAQRDEMNEQIAVVVVALRDAERLARATQPRRRAT